jgi:hypothetical protein
MKFVFTFMTVQHKTCIFFLLKIEKKMLFRVCPRNLSLENTKYAIYQIQTIEYHLCHTFLLEKVLNVALILYFNRNMCGSDGSEHKFLLFLGYT